MSFSGGELSHQMARIVIQLSVIILVARIAGEVTEKIFKTPGVLGELVSGMIIGPYALGGMIGFPGIGYLFPPPVAGESFCLNISCELFAIAQISSIILLFLAGLETDLRQFVRYAGIALVIAIGGVVVPFFVGAWFTYTMGYGTSITDIVPLFVGTILTATSVGITARVLSALNKLDGPEGVTIMAAAVVDDVAGVLILAGVLSLSTLGSFSLPDIFITGGKAILFLVVLMASGIIIARYFDRILSFFGSSKSAIVISMGFCFFAAATSVYFGLAMIIGAYFMGLALSTSSVAKQLRAELGPLYQTFVPIFFVVMGMLVDFKAMKPALVFGIILTILAAIGKVLGSGLPALLVGFNIRGATRIGLGMLPRGEVTLVVAALGLSSDIIGKDIFGVAILMIFVSSIIAPLTMVPAFKKGGKGIREGQGHLLQPTPKDGAFPEARDEGDDITSKHHHRHRKTWPVTTTNVWLPIFITVLEERGFFLRSRDGAQLPHVDTVHKKTTAPSGRFLSFMDNRREIVTISVSKIPLRDQDFISIASTSPDLNKMLKQADDIYSDTMSVWFLDEDDMTR